MDKAMKVIRLVAALGLWVSMVICIFASKYDHAMLNALILIIFELQTIGDRINDWYD